MVHRVADCGFAVAYVVEEEEGFLAVDVGSRGASERIEELITGALRRSIADIKYISATHFQIDHISGIKNLIEKCPLSTRVVFNYRVKEYLDGRKSLCPMRNWAKGLLPAAVHSSRHVHNVNDIPLGLQGIPLPVLSGFNRAGFDRSRITFAGGAEGNALDFGFDGWQILETPGHTEDSMSFFNPLTGDLICGDLILNFKKNCKGQLNRFHWDRAVIMDTFIKLKDTISPVNIYPGHGEVISDPGNALLGVEIF